MAVTRNDTARWASGVNIIAGFWLLLSPWIYSTAANEGGVWNSFIVGIAVVIIAALRVFGVAPSWLSWVNVALGIWMILSPWIYNYSFNTSRLWNSIIIGIIIAALGAISATAEIRRRRETRGPVPV